jgi:putative ABC transport system permease protein
MLWKYIRQDIGKRKGRFLFLILSVAIGVAAFTGILTINISAKADLDRQLESFGANMVIYPKSDDFMLNYGGISLTSVNVKPSEINESDIQKIFEIPNAENINIVSPKVIGIASADANKYVVVGVDFESELRLKDWWRVVGESPSEGEILLGYDLHNLGNIGPGETLNLNGIDFQVSGYINKTETQDDQVIFMNLGEAQNVHGKEGKISLIEVMAFCSTCPIEEIIRQIEEQMPGVKGMAARQLINSQMSMTSRFLNFGLAVAVFILFAGIVGLTTSMMSFVKEKTKEIGILRAVGFKKGDVRKIIVLEIMVVALAAGILGYLLGQVVAVALAGIFLNIPVSLNLSMITWAFVLAIMVCTLSTMLPLRTASRITVVEALRSL